MIRRTLLLVALLVAPALAGCELVVPRNTVRVAPGHRERCPRCGSVWFDVGVFGRRHCRTCRTTWERR